MKQELYYPAQLVALNYKTYSDVTVRHDWIQSRLLLTFVILYAVKIGLACIAYSTELWKLFWYTGIRDDWIQPCLSVIFAILYAVRSAVAYNL